MRRDDFRNLIREFLLVEEKTDDPTKEKEDGETSLDAQVDRLLISYEKEAKKSKNEGLDMRFLTRRFLLEADEDEKEDDSSPTAKNKGSAEDIDVESFAESLVRLVDNYDSLLEVRDTLIRRARNFLRKNYDDATVNDFLSILRDNFDIEVGMSRFEKELEVQPPPAARAGTSPG